MNRFTGMDLYELRVWRDITENNLKTANLTHGNLMIPVIEKKLALINREIVIRMEDLLDDINDEVRDINKV